MKEKDELQAQRNELFNHSEDTLARIKELDGELAELDKPKLRHGDYGIGGSDKCGFVLTLQSSGQKFFYSDGGGQVNALIHAEGHEVQGNIFDDIAARTEELGPLRSMADTIK